MWLFVSTKSSREGLGFKIWSMRIQGIQGYMRSCTSLVGFLLSLCMMMSGKQGFNPRSRMPSDMLQHRVKSSLLRNLNGISLINVDLRDGKEQVWDKREVGYWWCPDPRAGVFIFRCIVMHFHVA